MQTIAAGMEVRLRLPSSTQRSHTFSLGALLVRARSRSPRIGRMGGKLTSVRARTLSMREERRPRRCEDASDPRRARDQRGSPPRGLRRKIPSASSRTGCRGVLGGQCETRADRPPEMRQSSRGRSESPCESDAGGDQTLAPAGAPRLRRCHGTGPKARKIRIHKQASDRPQEIIYRVGLWPYMHCAGGHRLEALRLDSTWRLNFPKARSSKGFG